MGGDVTPGMLNFNDVCEMGTDITTPVLLSWLES